MPATYEDLINGVTTSVAVKPACRVATTANITLSGLQTIDGITVVADDRVLVKNQTDSGDNGIYVASSTTWARAVDFDGARDVVKGTLIFVNSGTANGAYTWRVTSSDPIVIGDDNINFVRHDLGSFGDNADNFLRITGSATGSNPQYVTIAAVGTTNTAVGFNFNSIGTSILGSQYYGAIGSPGKQFFKINGAKAFEITDNWWNPNVSYQGAPTAWLVASSGALAGGPDNIAVLGCNSSIYDGITVTGVTIMACMRGTTGAFHFTSNGVVGHVNVAAISNPAGVDTYRTAESSLWLYGSATGSSAGSVISTQGSTAIGTKFYDASTGGYEFQSDNTTTNLFKIYRTALGVNSWSVTPAIAGGQPIFAPYGSSANIGGIFKTKGTGNNNLYFYDGGALQALIGGSSASTSYLSLGGGADSVAISAQSGTNPVLTIYTVGTGGIDLKTSNTSNTILQLKDSFDVVMGNSAQATNATAGFLFIPSCAGPPTGVPAVIPSNRVALMYDRTNSKLYVYNGGWKSTAALT